MADLAEMVDASLPKPGKRGGYNKKIAASAMVNIKTTPEEIAAARYAKHVKKDKKKQRKYLPKSGSVRAVSGGLPTLGKRR